MQMEVLPCKTVPGVPKELTVFAIVYNLYKVRIALSGLIGYLFANGYRSQRQ
jgi:hypothetical protein